MIKNNLSEPNSELADHLEFPATPSQSHYWMLHKARPSDPCMNIAARWRVTGKLDFSKIEYAWQLLVDRHEALRTRLSERAGSVTQIVAPSVTLKVSYIDLRNLAEDERLNEAERIGKAEASKPFDPASAPLFRITLLRLRENEAHMLLTTHDLVSDCWANLTLVREFTEIFDALESGVKPNLPAVTMQFGDYAAWQNAWLKAGGANAASLFWQSKLKDFPNFLVPTDRAPPAVPTRRGEILGIPADNQIFTSATAAAKARGSTLFAFCLATFAAVLSRWSNQREIVVTTQIAAREEVELETVVGALINTIVFRIPVLPQAPFADLLGTTIETVSATLEHRVLPFEWLSNFVKLPQSDRRGPLWGVNFQVLNETFLRDAKGRGLAISGIPSISPGTKHDLNFYLVERNGNWRVQCEYDPDLFDAGTIEQLVQAFLSALATVSFDPSTMIANVPAMQSPDVETICREQKSLSHLDADGDRVSSVNLVSLETSSNDANDTELRLAEEWRKVLGIAEIAPNSNFFEMGGHSLSAIRLMKRINEVWQLQLPVSSLFKSPTLREFASLLPSPRNEVVQEAIHVQNKMAQKAIAEWQIVPIQPKGHKTPVIAINNTMIYYNLSRKLGTDRPFISIQLFDPEAPSELEPRTFEEIASDYVRVIQSVRPEGPYYLLGHCVAGALAFEIARQLRADGHRVPIVIMADTWLPNFRRDLPAHWRILSELTYKLRVVQHHMAAIYQGKDTVVGVIGKYRAGAKLLNFINATGKFPEISFGKEDWANRWFLPYLEEAKKNYRATKSGESLVLYCSDEMVTSFASARLGWDSIGEAWIHTLRVPGWHTDIFTGSGLDLLASDLDERLEEADRNSGLAS